MSDKIVEAQKVRRTATRAFAIRAKTARRAIATSDNGVNESNRSTR